MDCTDPRDRVYGVLSLVHEEEKQWLTIHSDYAKSTMQLFIDLSDLYRKRPNPNSRMLEHNLWQLQRALQITQARWFSDTKDSEGEVTEAEIDFRRSVESEVATESDKDLHDRLDGLDLGKGLDHHAPSQINWDSSLGGMEDSPSKQTFVGLPPPLIMVD
jgi:hypothetical protein